MLIITSDEDVIREFSSKKLKNTQIIELDQRKDSSSLSQIIEQVCFIFFFLFFHFCFSFNQNDEEKSSKPIRKSLDLHCAVCGAHAIGFNYDALSCGSCKAFFVRNSARDLVS